MDIYKSNLVLRKEKGLVTGKETRLNKKEDQNGNNNKIKMYTMRTMKFVPRPTAEVIYIVF